MTKEMISAFVCVMGISLLGLPTSVTAEDSKPVIAFQPLQAFEPSYLLVSRGEHDQNALRARMSMKYVFGQISGMSAEFFGSYTGEFDFYALTRPSSPVIGRSHNPAVHLRWEDKKVDNQNAGRSWMDLGFEHRSNGQAAEFNTDSARNEAQAAYLAQNYAYFDAVSHSSWYFSAEAQRQPFQSSMGQLALNAKVKFYVNKDTDVHWGPLRNSGVSISDYDRITLRALSDRGASAELIMGDKGFATASLNLDYGWIWRQWPFYVRVHWGPLNNLSDYTRSQRSIGFGLRFCNGQQQWSSCPNLY